MPVRSSLLLAAFVTFSIAAPATAAPPVTVTPQSIDITGKLGAVITSEYDPFGLRFSDAGANTTLFYDPPATPSNGWAASNGAGGANLAEPVNARIVIPGSGGIPATTSVVTVEAGVAAARRARDRGVRLRRQLARQGPKTDTDTGPTGRSLFTLAVPGIAAFRVRTPVSDTFVVTEIRLGETTPCLAADIVLSGDSSGAARQSRRRSPRPSRKTMSPSRAAP